MFDVHFQNSPYSCIQEVVAFLLSLVVNNRNYHGFQVSMSISRTLHLFLAERNQ